MIFLELWRLCNKYTTGISKAEAAAEQIVPGIDVTASTKDPIELHISSESHNSYVKMERYRPNCIEMYSVLFLFEVCILQRFLNSCL